MLLGLRLSSLLGRASRARDRGDEAAALEYSRRGFLLAKRGRINQSGAFSFFWPQLALASILLNCVLAQCLSKNGAGPELVEVAEFTLGTIEKLEREGGVMLPELLESRRWLKELLAYCERGT